jgi:D,D-heptose 1,7-bisphosphate phosphatase
MRPAAFLDRDGTIIFDEGYLADAARVRFLPGALDALRALRERGYRLVVVSNQSGVARGLITPAQHDEVHARFESLLRDAGVPLDAAYYCFHGPDDECECRKPKPGMLLRAAREHDLDLAASILIGDKTSDIAAGGAAGVSTTVLFSDWPSALDALELTRRV